MLKDIHALVRASFHRWFSAEEPIFSSAKPALLLSKMLSWLKNTRNVSGGISQGLSYSSWFLPLLENSQELRTCRGIYWPWAALNHGRQGRRTSSVCFEKWVESAPIHPSLLWNHPPTTFLCCSATAFWSILDGWEFPRKTSQQKGHNRPFPQGQLGLTLQAVVKQDFGFLFQRWALLTSFPSLFTQKEKRKLEWVIFTFCHERSVIELQICASCSQIWAGWVGAAQVSVQDQGLHWHIGTNEELSSS